ncbi:MAG: glycosyltransferase family 4 protein [Novosphingobium sp.]
MRILHIGARCDGSVAARRTERLIEAVGPKVEHAIVAAAGAVHPRIAVSVRDDFPALTGIPTPGRLQRIARAMQGYDLVLSHGWEAIDAPMAHTLFGQFLGLPPLVHHEDGLDAGELAGGSWRRNWVRRVALGRTAALVVPSRQVEALALGAWQQPPARVRRIGFGTVLPAETRKPRPDALPRVVKRKGELWLGAVAPLQPEEKLYRLVRMLAELPEPWQLVVVGEGPEREPLRADALRLGVAHRLHLPGDIADHAGAIALFDLFAVSSDRNRLPEAVIEAMATGLAVLAPNIGELAETLAEENRGLLTPPGDEQALAAAIAKLAGNGADRRGIGEANRRHARAEHDAKAMIAKLRSVYAQALRRPSLP